MAHQVAGAGAGPHRAGAAATTRCPGKADARLCAARHRDAVRGVGGRHRQGDRRLLPRHRHEEFLRFLKHVANTYPRRKLHIVVDNYATHKHPDVTSWLDRNKRITLHFTPTSESWLNMVLEQGVDFLGFTIRRYPNGKLLTKPSNDALRRIRRRLSAEVKALRGANAEALIAKLNPIITGWAAYYRIGVSKRAFAALDAHLWRLVHKWARLSHPNKSRHWVTAQYFGMFNPARRDTWVFGSRTSGFYLRKFAWTPIIRHRMVAATASPDDPSLTDYWDRRRRRQPPPLSTATLRLLRVQHGRCPLCRGLLLHADREPQSPREWEQWLTATRKAISKRAITVWGADTPDERVAHRVIHARCHQELPTAANPHFEAAHKPSGLA